MKFNDVAGDISINTEHLKSFVISWFDPEDLVVLVAISVDSPRRKVLAQVVTAKELTTLTEEDVLGLCKTETGERFNSYISVFPVKEDNNVHLYSRGTKEDIEKIYGVFVDLDVKEGCFENKYEIKDFLNSLALSPTIVVDNGKAGGVHAYWRLADGQTTEEELIRMWWCYLESKTDKKIDKLLDMTRVLRMPSAIYWPSRDSRVQMHDTVKTVKFGGPRYTVEQIMEVSKEAYEKRQERIAETIRKREVSRDEIGQIAQEIFGASQGGGGFTWSERLAIAKVEDIVNEKFDWEEILIPHGWTFRRELRDGSKEWARPGQSARSAVTDYTHPDGRVSPIMSLRSMSEDTLLSDLLEAEIPLSKYRVLLRLEYKDNEKAMLVSIRDRLLGK